MQDQNQSKSTEPEIPTPSDKSNGKDNSKNKNRIKEIFEWVEMIVVSFCVVVLIFTFAARPAVVVGDSMLNTLIDSETLVISPIADEYEYMDIVVFQLPQNLGKQHGDAIVKRVIATEGQWIDINLKTWKVYVADTKAGLDTAEPLDESYVNYIPSKMLSASVSFPLEVPEGCLFVMGDNRSESYDSRAFGCIKEEYVMGKVLFRLFPLSKFGKAG